MNFYDTDETEIRLIFTDLSQHFEIYLVVFALRFFIHGHGKGWRKVIYVVKLSHTTTTQIQNQKFSKFNEKIAERH